MLFLFIRRNEDTMFGSTKNDKQERRFPMAVTSNKPEVIATSRYSINETCAILGITRKTLAKYTTAGQIECGFRKATLRKFYTGLSILKFWMAAV